MAGPMLEVGHVVKAHGLRGEVVVELVTSNEARLAAGSTLADGRGGTLVVSSARRLPGRPGPRGERWLVQFEGVGDRNSSEALGSTSLFAEKVTEPAPGELWVHELIGSVVTEASGTARGTVTAVEANPASDLLVLDSGALVPLRFVTHVTPGHVVVEVPAGLFDL